MMLERLKNIQNVSWIEFQIDVLAITLSETFSYKF